jgi:hypothetical protein
MKTPASCQTSDRRVRRRAGAAVAVAMAGVLGAVEAQRPAPTDRQGPATEGVGLVRNDPGAYEGYTLLSPLQSRTTFLIDMDGRVVRSTSRARCACRTATR